MKLGMTGTQHGLTVEQIQFASDALMGWKDSDNVLHHGDCIGADVKLAEIAHALGYWVVAHPPTDPKKRAYHASDLIMPERPYLERNHNIVHVSKLMLAFPKEYTEQWRGSGTWATIRYTRKRKTMLVIAWPRGETSFVDCDGTVMNFGNVAFA
jgi:hypothetical protein